MGRRRLWFGVSGAIVAVAIASIVFVVHLRHRFPKGGTTVSFPRGSTCRAGRRRLLPALGSEPQSVVIVGGRCFGDGADLFETLTSDQTAAADALFEAFRAHNRRPAQQAGHQRLGRCRRPGAVRSPRRRWTFLVLVTSLTYVRYER